MWAAGPWLGRATENVVAREVRRSGPGHTGGPILVWGFTFFCSNFFTGGTRWDGVPWRLAATWLEPIADGPADLFEVRAVPLDKQDDGPSSAG